MKIIGFIVLLFTLIVSLFKVFHADLTNNVLAVALMVLLLSVFSDLHEFNFWGLRGTKEVEKLKEVAGKDAIAQENTPKVKPTQLKQAERQETVQLLGNDQGNFLALSFEIERLVRLSAAILSNHDLPSNITLNKTTQILKDKGLLTDDGVQQVQSIRWLRNMLVHGRENEITKSTLSTGFAVAQDLYTEIKDWLEGKSSEK